VYFSVQKVKVKALFIYIADQKASAYGCRFFCSACFQLRSTTTGTLLLIRRPRRISGRVDLRQDVLFHLCLIDYMWMSISCQCSHVKRLDHTCRKFKHMSISYNTFYMCLIDRRSHVLEFSIPQDHV